MSLKILNLGCGTKTHSELINIDWSIYAWLKKHRFLCALVKLLSNSSRLKTLNALPDNIIFHDLSKGIPFPNDSIDVVYHSHFMEHLDRDIVNDFLQEVRRVLKPGGIQRIVVPDFEKLCGAYINQLRECDEKIRNCEEHDGYIDEIIGQCVMKEAISTSQQRPIRRFLENLIIGDARKRGITHQWMYDRITIRCLLHENGFKNVKSEKYNTSSIPDWNKYGLDLDDFGNEYKTESFYTEAIK